MHRHEVESLLIYLKRYILVYFYTDISKGILYEEAFYGRETTNS
jgi:hypothetical protein